MGFFSKECNVHEADKWCWCITVTVGHFFDHVLGFFLRLDSCDSFIPGEFFGFALDVGFRNVSIDGQVDGCGKCIDFLLFAFHC